MSWRAIAVLAALLAPGGCSWTSERPATAAPPAVAAAASAATPPAATIATVPPAPAPPSSLLLLSTLRIEQVVGVSPATAGALLADVPEQLERDCHVRAPGMVQVRIRADGGEVDSTLQASSRDAAADACVLTVVAQNLDDALEPSTSPSESSPPVESVVTISW